MTACTKVALGYPLLHRQARTRLRQAQRRSVSTVAHGTTRANVAPVVLGRGHIASGERCESVAEKRSKQRTTAYTRLLAHAKDA
jgi:hypothetical protein